MKRRSFDVGILGAGSAGAALARVLADRDLAVVVFEPRLVGGECPFFACLPSKSMLHDSTGDRTWAEATTRRDAIVSHLDDSEHARELREHGVEIVRAPASIADVGAIDADGVRYEVDHIVIATGAAPVFPDISGLDPTHDRVWTSRDGLVASHRPESVVIVGGGVIGSELAFMFAGFGVAVTTLDVSSRPAEDFHPAVSGIITETLVRAGVTVRNGIEIERVDLHADRGTVHLSDGTSHDAERVLVATGRAPDYADLGLESVGLHPSEIDVDERGAVTGVDRLWIAGDAAGGPQYTHVANHHAAVLADQITGSGTRRYDDAVVPACMFLDPPVMVVGPTWAELEGDDDVVWAEIEFDTARSSTDEFTPGFLAVGARRSSGCLVAANGVGARFDELAHAIVIAIDGAVPVATLRRTIQPFPTAGDVLTDAFDRLGEALGV